MDGQDGAPPAGDGGEPKPKNDVVVGKKKRRRGPRGPYLYSQDIAQKICMKISQGKQIREVCKLPGYPSKTTFFAWLHEHEDFARAYALAKQCYAEDVFDENVKIADGMMKISARSSAENAPKIANMIRAAKVAIDTRFRTAAKLAPKKYGERAMDPLLPQSLPPPEDDDIEGEEEVAVPAEAASNVTPLEHHPLYDQLKAWGKVGKTPR